MLPFYYIAFVSKLITQMPPKMPEIWRVVTPFFVTGPKFGILMDPYFRTCSFVLVMRLATCMLMSGYSFYVRKWS